MSTPLDPTSLFGSVVDNALETGVFESVNGHEPLSSPGHGITAAVWIQNIKPYAMASGLSVASALLVFNVRIYSNAIQEPQDAIDPNLLSATALLMGQYVGEFTLADQVRNVDVFGESGTMLEAIAGYIEQNGAVYRVMTITLPMIIDDMWVEVP